MVIMPPTKSNVWNTTEFCVWVFGLWGWGFVPRSISFFNPISAMADYSLVCANFKFSHFENGGSLLVLQHFCMLVNITYTIFTDYVFLLQGITLLELGWPIVLFIIIVTVRDMYPTKNVDQCKWYVYKLCV